MCQACGQTEGVLEWHSENYSQPYGDHIGQFGWCYFCHMLIHCRFKAEERWGQYARAIANGWRFAPSIARDFGRVTRFLADRRAEKPKRVAPTGSTLLLHIAAGMYRPPPPVAILAPPEPAPKRETLFDEDGPAVQPPADPWDSPDAPEITETMFD